MTRLADSVRSSDYRERERAHFDALAEASGEIWWGHDRPAGTVRLRRRAALLAEQLRAFRSPRVLEVGCGAGIFTKTILEIIPDIELTAIDISPKSLEVAQSRCSHFENVRLIVGDATAPDVGSGAYDAVVGNSILHHLRLADFLPSAFGALAPGGLFHFFEPNMMNPQIALEKNVRPIGKWLQNSEDETAFFRWSLRRRLAEAGFERVAIKPFDFMHPAAPGSMLAMVDLLGRALERIPLVREIAGSLHISARKPL